MDGNIGERAEHRQHAIRLRIPVASVIPSGYVDCILIVKHHLRLAQWFHGLTWAVIILFAPQVFGLEKIIREKIETSYSVENGQFSNTVSYLLGAPLVGGNKIETLINGDQIFPSMLKAISQARRSITFESFLWHSGKISDQFIEALSERSRAGVQVHCLVDGMGRLEFNSKDRKRLRKAGVHLVTHNPVRWFRPWRWNERTHRKIMVIDGTIGFTGGVCISDDWMGNAEDKEHWRDTHFRIEGPVVAQIQGVFMDNWIRSRSAVLHGEAYFPFIASQGGLAAQCFKSGSDDSAENARLLYLYSIAAAKKTIRLSHSYFIPDDLAVSMLVDARLRGVKIEIIVPGVIDHNIVRMAARTRWYKLLECGVEIYEYEPSKYHCKVMIVDDLWTTFGSINFDDRSFRINDESNVNVYDSGFAAEQVRIFEADKAKSHLISLEEHKARPWHTRLAEALCALLRNQL